MDNSIEFTGEYTLINQSTGAIFKNHNRILSSFFFYLSDLMRGNEQDISPANTVLTDSNNNTLTGVKLSDTQINMGYMAIFQITNNTAVEFNPIKIQINTDVPISEAAISNFEIGANETITVQWVMRFRRQEET